MTSSLPKASAAQPRVTLGIATRGRPDLLRLVLERVARQSLLPAKVIVAASSAEDVRGLAASERLEILYVQPGLARQRNAVLDAAPANTDIVAFFDDDFVPHDDWLSAVASTFAQDERIACVTGDVIADGILGAGIRFEDACAIATQCTIGDTRPVENYSPYGCNMAFRASALGGARFDERLVLYGWLEDRDFGGQLARAGWRLVKIGSARGVHMGIKQGRVPGRKLGYSQLVNPVYMLRKGTIDLQCASEMVIRNLCANLFKSIAPETYVDRRGRLQGNFLALLDLCRGRLTPERAEAL